MVAAFYAALLGLFFVGLSIHVIRGRRRLRIALADGNQEEMKRRIRAHGNFAEYAPLFLIMLGYAEYEGL